MLEDTTLAEDPTGHADAWAKVRSVDGILVPGGFGERGTEGKILTAKYARENKVPFLGICLHASCGDRVREKCVGHEECTLHRNGTELPGSCRYIHARRFHDSHGWHHAPGLSTHDLSDS